MTCAPSPRRVLGLMSGTSCDGIDAVACELSGQHGASGRIVATLVRHVEHAFEPHFAARLRSCGSAQAPELARLHAELGQRFGQAALAVRSAAGWAAEQVAVVALAGHTAVHLPPDGDDAGCTLALGDGDRVAEICGCPVLADMRARDRAVGGQGAPLVPQADAWLLRQPGQVVAALNLGGIANLTVIPPEGPPLAFDTGPANMLLDAALRRASDGLLGFDEGGQLGLAGRVDERWLEAVLAADSFLTQAPPRSTGRERYGEAWLDAHWSHLGTLTLPDLAATLTAHAVQMVARSVALFVDRTPARWVLSGGGARNACMLTALARLLAPAEVLDSEAALGVPVSAREALAFAVLADAALAGFGGNVPSVTGASRAVRLGKLCLPPSAGVTLPAWREV